MTSTPMAAGFRLPVLATVASAYGFALRDREALARLAFGPVLALALLVGLGTLLHAPRTAFAFVAVVVQFALLTTFAIACQRRFLVAGEPESVLVALSWRRRHWTYLSALLLIFATTLVSLATASIALGTVQEGGMAALAAAAFGLGLVVAALYASSRLSLMLPAAAVDERAQSRMAWQRTEGNGWRMVLVNIAAALPLALANMVVSVVFEQILTAFALRDSVTAIFLGTLVSVGLSFAGLAVSALALAAAYRALIAARG